MKQKIFGMLAVIACVMFVAPILTGCVTADLKTDANPIRVETQSFFCDDCGLEHGTAGKDFYHCYIGFAHTDKNRDHACDFCALEFVAKQWNASNGICGYCGTTCDHTFVVNGNSQTCSTCGFTKPYTAQPSTHTHVDLLKPCDVPGHNHQIAGADCKCDECGQPISTSHILGANCACSICGTQLAHTRNSTDCTCTNVQCSYQFAHVDELKTYTECFTTEPGHDCKCDYCGTELSHEYESGYDQQHNWYYGSLCAICGKTNPIDMVTDCDEGREYILLDEATGVACLAHSGTYHNANFYFRVQYDYSTNTYLAYWGVGISIIDCSATDSYSTNYNSSYNANGDYQAFDTSVTSVVYTESGFTCYTSNFNNPIPGDFILSAIRGALLTSFSYDYQTEKLTLQFNSGTSYELSLRVY